MLVDYAKTAALNTLFKGLLYTQPAHLYVGLSTTDLLADGSGLTEVSTSGTAYARVIVDAWTITGNQVTNTNAVTFVKATASWGTPIQWFCADALTAGNIIARGPIIYPNTLESFTAEASTDKLYVENNPFANGDQVRLIAETIPTGLDGNTSYYVIGVSADSLQLSLTNGGAAVNITADGHGWIAKDFAQPVAYNNTVSFAAGALVGVLEG